MNGYIAELDGAAVFLSADAQIDKFLQKGWSIYKLENNNKKLIATPGKGFVAPRPTIESTFLWR